MCSALPYKRQALPAPPSCPSALPPGTGSAFPHLSPCKNLPLEFCCLLWVLFLLPLSYNIDFDIFIALVFRHQSNRLGDSSGSEFCHLNYEDQDLSESVLYHVFTYGVCAHVCTHVQRVEEDIGWPPLSTLCLILLNQVLSLNLELCWWPARPFLSLTALGLQMPNSLCGHLWVLIQVFFLAQQNLLPEKSSPQVQNLDPS